MEPDPRNGSTRSRALHTDQPYTRNGSIQRRKNRAIGVRPIAVEFYLQTHGQDAGKMPVPLRNPQAVDQPPLV